MRRYGDLRERFRLREGETSTVNGVRRTGLYPVAGNGDSYSVYIFVGTPPKPRIDPLFQLSSDTRGPWTKDLFQTGPETVGGSWGPLSGLSLVPETGNSDPRTSSRRRETPIVFPSPNRPFRVSFSVYPPGLSLGTSSDRDTTPHPRVRVYTEVDRDRETGRQGVTRLRVGYRGYRRGL